MFTGIITEYRHGSRKLSPLKEGIKLRVATNYDPQTIDLGASIAHAGHLPDRHVTAEAGSNERWFEVEHGRKR